MADGPAAGLDSSTRCADEPSLASYHLLPSVRGDLLAKLGRLDEARAEFERAASLTRNRASASFCCCAGKMCRCRAELKFCSTGVSVGTLTLTPVAREFSPMLQQSCASVFRVADVLQS